MEAVPGVVASTATGTFDGSELVILKVVVAPSCGLPKLKLASSRRSLPPAMGDDIAIRFAVTSAVKPSEFPISVDWDGFLSGRSGELVVPVSQTVGAAE